MREQLNQYNAISEYKSPLVADLWQTFFFFATTFFVIIPLLILPKRPNETSAKRKWDHQF